MMSTHLRFALVFVVTAAGCAVDNSALLDSGAELPPYDGGGTLDIVRPPPFTGMCAGDASPLPDGACPGGTSSDGGMITTDGPAPPPPPPPPPPCNEVTFEYESSTANTVWLSGSFVRWAPNPTAGAIVLNRGANNVWSATTRIEPQGRHEYKFIVNGTMWIPDPRNPERVSDNNGGFNSVLNVCGASPAMCGDLTAFDWRDAVMYFVMTDRFFDSDGRRMTVMGATDGDATRGASGQYMGGDLAGVTMKMPYLADLGVSAVWLSAPYKARDVAGGAINPAEDSHVYSSYHGYWPSPDNISYASPQNPSPVPRVEPRLGTSQDLEGLVTAAHGATTVGGHGIRVLFDYVMKHVDTESGLYRAHNNWFARENGQFRLCGGNPMLWDDPFWGTRCAFTSYLAPFDFDNSEARAWSVNDAVWWTRRYNLDGLRLDAIKHVPLPWLTELRTRLNNEVRPSMGGRFYMVGETFNYDDRGLLRSFVNPTTMLDGQFDFPFKARLCEALFTPNGNLGDFASWMSGNDTFYGTNALMSTFIGNHDIPRAIHFASRQITDCRQGSYPGNSWTNQYTQPTDAAPYERLGVAFAVMLTNPGVPLIYYGDEIGLAGGGDPDNRRMMPWSDTALNAHQIALRTRVGALARARAQNLALARGSRTTLSSSQDTWVYRRGGCGMGASDVIVAINRADSARMVDIPMGAYEDLLRMNAVTMGGRVEVPARGFLVWRAR
jgi:glycosidase